MFVFVRGSSLVLADRFVPCMYGYMCLACMVVYALYVCMPYMFALDVCLICVPCMYAYMRLACMVVYALYVCMPYMCALHVCLMCEPWFFDYTRII